MRELFGCFYWSIDFAGFRADFGISLNEPVPKNFLVLYIAEMRILSRVTFRLCCVESLLIYTGYPSFAPNVGVFENYFLWDGIY